MWYFIQGLKKFWVINWIKQNIYLNIFNVFLLNRRTETVISGSSALTYGFCRFSVQKPISVAFGIMPLIFCINKILNNQMFLLQSSSFQVYEDNQCLYRRLFWVNIKKRVLARNLITTCLKTIQNFTKIIYLHFLNN